MLPSVLHISCHPHMDRRIISELNYLADHGWDVSFLHTPIDLHNSGLSDKVRLFPVLSFEKLSRKQNYNGLKQRIVYFIYFILSNLPVCCSWIYHLALKAYYVGILKKLEAFRDSYAETPDIIHVHDVWLLNYAKQLRKKYYPNAKLVYDAHEFTPYQTASHIETAVMLNIERKGLHGYDAVISVNQSIAERMSEIYNMPIPRVLYNSVSTEFLSQRKSRSEFLSHWQIEECNWNDSNVIILFQGSLAPERNLEQLVYSFTLLPKYMHLFILGDGILKNKLEDIIKNLNIGDRVHMAPAVDQLSLNSFTSTADFGIVPYLPFGCENNRLATPNKFFEYIAAEVPICASDLPEFRKILTKYGNGKTYPMNSVKEIADALIEFDHYIHSQSGIFPTALKNAKNAFSYSNQGKVLSVLYDDLLNLRCFPLVSILHLPSNISSQMSSTVNALRKKRISSYGLTFDDNIKQSYDGLETLHLPHLNLKNLYKVIFYAPRAMFQILNAIINADIIHWYGTCAFPRGIDVVVAKILGKNGIVEYLGSDIRIPEIVSIDNEYLKKFYQNNPSILKYENSKSSQKNQELFSRFGFQAVLSESMFSSINKTCFPDFKLMRTRVAVNDFPLCLPEKDRKVPLIVHMPSNPEIKGTAYVLAAIEKLKQEYVFEFKLIQNCSHKEAVKQLSECDIFLDQFVLGAYGVVSVEAMSYGKPVVCYLNDGIKQYYPADCPIVNADPENLHEALIPLLQNAKLRQDIGKLSRQYAEKYHDSDKTVNDLLDIYRQEWEKKKCRQR